MKKLLFTLLAFSALQKSEAQSIYNETCEGLTIGDIGTDITGFQAGQGALFTNATFGPEGPSFDAPSNSDFQVINTGIFSTGKALQIKGSVANGKTRTITKDISQAWNSRTLGNNTVVIKFRVYLPTLSATSDNTFRFSIKSSSKTFCSLTINKSTALAGRYDIRGNYFNGVQSSPLLPSISYRPSGNNYEDFILMYNLDTGNFRVIGNTLNNPLFDVNATGVPPDSILQDILFSIKKSDITSTQNASSMAYNVDNIVVNAENTPLSVDENTLNNSFIAFFDSTNNIIKINTNDDINIKAITIYNINGSEIKQNIYNNIKNTEINVLEFPAGIYILKVRTDKGTVNKKIVKA